MNAIACRLLLFNGEAPVINRFSGNWKDNYFIRPNLMQMGCNVLEKSMLSYIESSLSSRRHDFQHGRCEYTTMKARSATTSTKPRPKPSR